MIIEFKSQHELPKLDYDRDADDDLYEQLIDYDWSGIGWTQMLGNSCR